MTPMQMILALIKDKKTVSSSKVGSSGAKAKVSSKAKAKASNPADDSDSDIELIESKPSSTSTSRPKATNNDSSTSDIEVIHPALGWVYVGSHNFTQSAWGTLSGSGFNPVLNVTNYELGVVFPIKDEEQLRSVQLWERPPRRYGKEDEPWVSRFMVAH